MNLQKKKPVRDPEYLGWIRLHICAAGCITGPTEAAHVGRTGKGMGQKCDDHETIPLCRDCHQRLHNKGERWFEKHNDMNLALEAKRYYRMYKGES